MKWKLNGRANGTSPLESDDFFSLAELLLFFKYFMLSIKKLFAFMLACFVSHYFDHIWGQIASHLSETIYHIVHRINITNIHSGWIQHLLWVRFASFFMRLHRKLSELIERFMWFSFVFPTFYFRFCSISISA